MSTAGKTGAPSRPQTDSEADAQPGAGRAGRRRRDPARAHRRHRRRRAATGHDRAAPGQADRLAGRPVVGDEDVVPDLGRHRHRRRRAMVAVLWLVLNGMGVFSDIDAHRQPVLSSGRPGGASST